MNTINFKIRSRPVSLIVYDEPTDGPAFEVVAIKSKIVDIPFARFKDLGAACEYRDRYSAYYPYIRFYIRRTLF